MTRRQPSGRQLDLHRGDSRVTVVEVGGGLRSFTAGGLDVLDGYAEDRMCRGGRGQLLIPWPNRIADGSFELAGEIHQLALTEPALHHAIHGLVRWLPWQLDQHAPDVVLASCVLHPQPGYPFRLLCTTVYRLDDAGLSVLMTVTNRCDRPAPVGIGAHPYLAVGAGLVDDARVRIPASARLVTDERSIPRGRTAVAGTPYDYRQARPVGVTVLDTTYTGLAHDADGMARVRIDRADGVGITLWADRTWPYLQVFTGDPLPEPERRRSLAVEPMTCPPNAFASGDGLRLVGPGEQLSGTWGIAVG